jgi:pantoate--beta-alanine ligase
MSEAHAERGGSGGRSAPGHVNTTAHIADARKLCDDARHDGKRVGFVPTMGALHHGHRSLIARAGEETDFVVVSIFVNPTQFAPTEDLSKYPRTFADDLEICATEGVDLVFHPEPDEMYPEGATTTVIVDELTHTMEGAHRPGHFDGVATICAKLFNIVGACTAFFGEKDAQQLRVVRRMARDLDVPVDVVGCPTIRDTDGLALSSRNVYLTTEDRKRALALPQALQAIAKRVGTGEVDVSELLETGREVLQGADAVDYLEIVDPETLGSLERIDGNALVCGAIRIGKTRLIDNVLITKEQK